MTFEFAGMSSWSMAARVLTSANDRRDPAIFPVDDVVIDGAVVLRTAPGSKLDAAARGAVVAFEVDAHDDDLGTGWSVLAIGPAEVVHDLAVTCKVLAAGLEPPGRGAEGSRSCAFALIWSPAVASSTEPPAKRWQTSARMAQELRFGVDRPHVRRVLVVEDDAHLRRLCRLALEPRGWHVVEAASATTGLQQAATADPDVVLLDLGLPDATGASVLAALKADPATAWRPVVVLSARADPQTASRLLLDGAQDFLVKPTPADELHARLVAARRVAVEHRRLADSERRHRVLLDHLPDRVVLTFDRDLRVLAAGGGLLRSGGYDPDRLVGMPLASVQPDDVDELLPRYQRALAGERVTFEHRHSSGRTFLLRVLPHDGGVFVIADDITELRAAEAQVEATERRYAAILENLTDLVSVVDDRGRILYVSPSCERIVGRRPEDRSGRSIFDFVHPDDLGKTAAAFASVLAGADGPVFEARLWHESGEWRTVEVSTNNRLDDPDIRGIVVTSRDVTERRHLEDALRDVERQFEQVFERAATGMTIVDPTGRLQRVNPAYCEMVGYSAPELATMTIFDVTHPDDVGPTRRSFDSLVSGAIADYQLDKRLRRADGAWIWTRVTVSAVRDADGQALYTIGQVVDISDTKELAERLVHEATHDPLTGLLSRGVLEAGVRQRLAAAERELDDIAVLLVDIDDFKAVNDRFGHAVGDAVLVEVAERLQRAVRHADLLVRLGGDEFVVVLGPPSGSLHAADVARRIVESVDQPYARFGDAVSIGASVGIAVTGDPSTTLERILASADHALYRAKAAGRGTYEFAGTPSSSVAAARD